MATTKKQSLSQKQQPFSPDRPIKVKQLQALTREQLDNISGAGVKLNHNENLTSVSNSPEQSKPSSETQSSPDKKLQTLTLTQLDSIAGAGVRMNHNETIVKL